jgi:hypothetical protein
MSGTAQTSAARLGIEATQMELTQHLMAEDPLAVVIRGHLYIERELLNFMDARGLPKNQVPTKYAHRVQRAVKLGLPNGFSKQLILMGKLRNRFGHHLNAKISKADAEEFANAYALGDDGIQYAYQNTLAKLDDGTRPRSVTELEPKERIVLHIIVLWAGIAVATAKANGIGVEGMMQSAIEADQA